MIIYILILSVFLLFLLLRYKYLYKNGFDKNNYYDNILIIFFIILILGIAYYRNISVGTDYPMYYGWYFKPQAEEIGYQIIYYIAQQFNNPYLITAISTFIFLIFSVRAMLKMTNEITTSIFFFISSYFVYFVFNGMRQAVACAIIFLGLSYIYNQDNRLNFKNTIIYFICVIFSLLFHSSGLYAVILIILVFFSRKRVTKRIISIVSIIIIIGYFTPLIKNLITPLFNMFDFYINKYANNYDFFFLQNKEKGLLQFIPILIQLLILYFFADNKISDKKVNFKQWYYLLFLSIYSVSGIEAMDRIQFYFIPSIILYYDFLIHKISKSNYKDNRVKYIYILFIIVFWSLYYILRLIQNTNGIVPYIFR